MKYTLMGFSQAAALSLTATDSNGKELKLDITDLTILRVFTDFFNSTGMKKITDNGITYGWINYNYFLRQIPIIGIQKRAFYNRLQKMVTLGVLVHHTQTNDNNTKSAYYGLGANYNKLLGYSEEENIEEEPENDNIENTQGMYQNTQGMYQNTQGSVSEYMGGMYQTAHNSSIIDSSIRKEEKTTTTTKAAEPSFPKNEKKSKAKQAGYDEIINSYTTNEELKTTLIEFVKMRKAIKKPLTDNALKLITKKLDSIASNDNEKIKILENSIVGGWQGIYALKAEDKQQAQQQQQADEMQDYWNQFVVPVEG